MAQEPEPNNSTRIPYCKEDENTPKKKTKKYAQQELAEDTGSVHQVSQPQPSQYWLGRFVTLTNAFHFEDSFNQPDVATGFGMLSSYSHPLGFAEKNLPNYGIKRAFMVLENACVKEEASRNLRDFQDEYIAIHGNRWMALLGYFVFLYADRGAPKVRALFTQFSGKHQKASEFGLVINYVDHGQAMLIE